jgi:thiosulfate reductase cytochrome b subunit
MAWVDEIAIALWDVAAWVLWAAAVVAVFRAPAGRFVHGWYTKAGRVAVVALVSLCYRGLFLPVGAVVVWFALRRSRPGGPAALPPAPPAR